MDNDLLDVIGDPVELERGLAEFRETARVLSSRQRQFITRYPKKWVAVYRGQVAASASTLRGLMEEVKRKDIPRGQAIVRYIDRSPRKLIL